MDIWLKTGWVRSIQSGTKYQITSVNHALKIYTVDGKNLGEFYMKKYYTPCDCPFWGKK